MSCLPVSGVAASVISTISTMRMLCEMHRQRVRDCVKIVLNEGGWPAVVAPTHAAPSRAPFHSQRINAPPAADGAAVMVDGYRVRNASWRGINRLRAA